MTRFIAFAEQLLLMKVLKDHASYPRIGKAVQACLALAMLLFAVAFFFFVAGFYVWLRTMYPLHTAAMLTSAMILVLCAASGGTAYLLIRKKMARVKEVQQEVKDRVLEVFDSIAAELEEPIAAHPQAAILAASVAGFAAGEKFL